MTDETLLTKTAVSVREITKTYPALGGRGVSTAVNAVSLSIEPGELFFLLGPSGCGKTTLLRMIAGFIEPTSGSISFADSGGARDVTHLAPEKRNTGMVFQSYALWPHMTVAQNIAFGLDVRCLSGIDKATRVKEALAAVRMEGYESRKPTQLSGGQQQRVALARALVIRPAVLLLDEPLSNLDAKLRHELRAEIRRICKSSGLTTVYVTHDQKEALSMADRVAVMSAGEVQQLGPPRELYRRPRSRFVAEFLGETNIVSGTATDGSLALGLGRLRLPTASSGPVTLAVRPESVTPVLAGAAGSLDAVVTESEYLGESVQLSARVSGGPTLRASVLNPGDSDALRPGAKIGLVIRPDDVTILPEE